MNINLATVEALRPDPVDMDPAWADATLSTILADQPGPVRRAGSRPRSRAALVSLAVAASTAVGGGVAFAASDFAPESFTEAFAFWKTSPAPGHQSVDPADAERVATAPGPEGSVFSVISTPGDYACHTAVLESASSAAEAVPSSFLAVTGNWCSATSHGREFGSADVSFQDRVAGFIVSAGDATQASVRTRDGREFPALHVDGQFWGWFPQDAHPTLVGYARDGSVVGQVDLGTGSDGGDRFGPTASPTSEPSN